jgi:hypothetical protein
MLEVTSWSTIHLVEFLRRWNRIHQAQPNNQKANKGETSSLARFDQLIKLHIVQFSPSSSNLLSRRTKYSSQRPVLRHFQFICMHVSEKKNLLKQWTIFQEMKVNPNSCSSQHGGRPMITEAMLYLNDVRENVPCDAVLRLEDVDFHDHIQFLSECSSYFRFVWLLMWLINVPSWDIIWLQDTAEVN